VLQTPFSITGEDFNVVQVFSTYEDTLTKNWDYLDLGKVIEKQRWEKEVRKKGSN